MKFGIIVCLLLGWTSLFLFRNKLPNNPPKYLELKVDWKEVYNSEKVFEFKNPDTLIEHQIHLLSDSNELPLFYYSNIQTPVCIDALCKPLYIELYWDLVGQYVGYGVYPEQLLSKFDHEVFEQQDYLKLHQLLLNAHSILERRKLTDLYDIGKTREKQITFKGKEVDGVSGATKKEVKSTVVEGALYSCYTLWHLAYGEAASKIKQQLPSIYSDSLAASFLQSDYEAYQMYALKQLSGAAFEENIAHLIPILENGKPLTRAYILKKMPKSLFGHALIVNKLYKSFSELDFNSKTLLLKNLSFSNQTAFTFLSQQLSAMSKNQLKTFLSQLENHKAFQTETILKNLENYAAENYTYSHLVNRFLDQAK